MQGIFAPGSQGSLVTHTVWAETDLQMILYSPGQIQQAVLPASALESLSRGLYVDKFGCIVAPGGTLSLGAQYRVVSYPLEVAASSSPEAPAVAAATAVEMDEAYLRIPISARRTPKIDSMICCLSVA